MKVQRPFRKTFLLLAAIPLLLTSGCLKENFDVPPLDIPHFSLPEGATIISITELKARHTILGQLDSIHDNVYITGIVTGNDEFGNIYKTIVIQDTGAGIELKLNKTSLYNDYKLGQRLYVKCQGLVLGDYNGLIQLGSVYNNGVGQIAEVNISNHLFKDELPGAVPEAKLIASAADLNTNDISKLVRFDNAVFADAGLPFVAPGEDNTNRVLNINGGTIDVRTSKYATFSNTNLPSGPGTVTAILGYYSGSYQLTVRNTADLSGFIPDKNVTLLNEVFETDPGWSTYIVASNQNWTWDATYKCMVGNNYGGSAPGNVWMFTPAISLTGLDSAYFSFRIWSKYADGGMTEPLKIWISSNYTAGNDPSTATWTQLSAVLDNYTETWTPSGKIDITAFVGQTVRIAWQYQSSGTTSGSASKFEVDAVLVKGVTP